MDNGCSMAEIFNYNLEEYAPNGRLTCCSPNTATPTQRPSVPPLGKGKKGGMKGVRKASGAMDGKGLEKR